MAYETNHSIGVFIDGGYYAKINEGLQKVGLSPVNLTNLFKFIPDHFSITIVINVSFVDKIMSK